MKKIILSCTLILLLAAGAQAGTVIDFTDFVIDTSTLGRVYNTTVPVLGIGDIDLRFAAQAAAGQTSNTNLWWDDIDGFGVQYSYEPDEIESPEFLLMEIETRGGPVFLNRFGVADLFNEGDPLYLEVGLYKTSNSTDWVPFEALPGQLLGSTNGERWVEVNQAVTGIRFTALGFLQNGENHEFALQKIEVSAVPVPPAVLLLGSGILGLVGLRRKFRKI